MMKFNTCHTCAVAVVNDDLSGLDYSHDAEDMDLIVASIESMGWVTMTKEEDNGGYFECYVCSEVCLGTMATFESA